MAKIQEVIHQNYLDGANKVFCKKSNKIVNAEGNYKNCDTCPYFYGGLQGNGVECQWVDLADSPLVTVSDPVKELMRVSKLIDNGDIKKN